MKQLIQDLEIAEQHLAQFKGGSSVNYASAEDFLFDFYVELQSLKNGNEGSIFQFYEWFLPTGDWDDFTMGHEKSIELGNRIFRQLSAPFEQKKRGGSLSDSQTGEPMQA